MGEQSFVDGCIGRLFSDGGPQPSAMFDSHGEFIYFVPGAPTGRQPADPDIIIGFIDSGTTSHHPQLAGLVIEEKTFLEGPVRDEIGHGTLSMLVAASVEPSL